MPKPKVMDLQLSEPPPWKCPKVFKNQQQLCLAHSASCKRPNQAFLFEDFRLQNYADWLPLPGFFLQREAKLVTRFLNRKRKVLPKKVSSPLLSKRIKKSRRSQVEVKSSAKHIVHPRSILYIHHWFFVKHIAQNVQKPGMNIASSRMKTPGIPIIHVCFIFLIFLTSSPFCGNSAIKKFHEGRSEA